MKTIKTFIFDCDGTVLNTLPDLTETTNRTLMDLGYPTHSQDEIVSYIGDGARRLIDQALPSGSTDEEQAKAFEHWCKVYVELGFKLSKRYPGMEDTLEELKHRGCKLAVLSNKIDSATQLVVEQYYPGLFDLVYGEREGIPRKPDPMGLNSMIRELKADPDETLYAGDAVTDVEVAKRAGVYAVAVDWGYTSANKLESSRPDYIAHRPEDFLQFAQR